jgi:hypothetical protein
MSPFRAVPPRVARDRRDDRYVAGRWTPYARPAAGWVESVQDDTCTVDILGESITGVIYLDDEPSRGDLVEIETRGDLVVVLNWHEHPPPPEPKSVIIPLTAPDYFFKPGSPTNTTDHFQSSALFNKPALGGPWVQIPEIEANSSWGSSVHTDDDTGYSMADSVGFDAAAEATYKPPSGQYYLTTIGAMTKGAAVPATATKVRCRMIVRTRNSIASTLEESIYFGTAASYNDEYLTPSVTTTFTRHVSGWYGVTSTRLASLKAGQGVMTLRAAGPNGTFNVAYMAIEIEWDWDVTP